jgi:hypothetical protein
MARDEVIEYLTEGEALRLAATVPVGRVVDSRYAMPAVHLVNFRLDGRDVVFRTRKGAKFAAAVADTVVAFEADRFDEAGRGGWTVTLTGRSSLVTRPEEISRLERLDVDPWLPGREYFVRVHTRDVTGRRIGPHGPRDEDRGHGHRFDGGSGPAGY